MNELFTYINRIKMYCLIFYSALIFLSIRESVQVFTSFVDIHYVSSEHGDNPMTLEVPLPIFTLISKIKFEKSTVNFNKYIEFSFNSTIKHCIIV